MHEIKEVLRLSFDAGLSPRQVAASLSLSRTTVRRYLDRAERAGVGWPLPAGLDEMALERALFPPAPPSGSPGLSSRLCMKALGLVDRVAL
jgi:hypothetical protein